MTATPQEQAKGLEYTDGLLDAIRLMLIEVGAIDGRNDIRQLIQGMSEVSDRKNVEALAVLVSHMLSTCITGLSRPAGVSYVDAVNRIVEATKLDMVEWVTGTTVGRFDEELQGED